MTQKISRLTKWLQEANLGQYAELFTNAAVDLDMVAELTKSELLELGLPIGDQLRLRRHLETSPPAQTREAIQLEVSGKSVKSAEHRQITVLFCDLVGWTALSTEFDSEDLSDVISECRAIWTQAIERYNGFVAYRLGDGMMAFFGHPYAYEDGAERAIISGLDIVTGMNELREASQNAIARNLNIRVGIATGKVLINKTITGTSEEVDVLGYTPNLAARLQSVARPNSILVSPTSATLAQHRFNFSAGESVKLKGIEDPLRVYEVLGRVRGGEHKANKFDNKEFQIVGRAHEIGMLEERWSASQEGDGQIIVLSGEAGVGKSRIADALFKRAKSPGTTKVRLDSSSYYSKSSLHPFVDFLHTRTGINDADPSEVKLAKLHSFLDAWGLKDSRDHDLMANLLGIAEMPEDRPVVSSERQKKETLDCIVRFLLYSVDHHPTIILFEDAHWADPTSIELVETLAAKISALKALLIVTTRDDDRMPIKRLPNVSCLRMSRLPRSQAGRIIRNMSRDAQLPENLVSQIIDKSDGIPLFLEEMTKTVCANVGADAAVRRTDGHSDGHMTIPATLYDSLLSRIDKYPEARDVAGCAAAIGREFSEVLLSSVLAKEINETRRIIDILLKAGLFIENSLKAEASYLFKHALVQDAVYEGMTRSTRRGLHGRIAFILEGSFETVAKRSPEILAQHYFLAKNEPKALQYWEQAGRLNMERSATNEALTHLSRAISILDAKPNELDRMRQKISLLTAYGAALSSVKGYTAPETVAAFNQAWRLSKVCADTTYFHEIVYGMWNSAQVGSDYERAQELANSCLIFSKKQKNDVTRLVAHNLCGVTSTLRGDHKRAQEHLMKSVSLYDPTRFQSIALSTGEDPGVESLSFLALNSWCLGDPKSALEHADRSLALAKEIAYKQPIIYSLAMRGVLLHFFGSHDELVTLADEIIRHSEKQDYPFFVEWGRNLKGWALSNRGEHDEGLELMSNKWQQGFSTLLLSKVYLQMGRRDAGLELIDHVIQYQPWLEPEARRVRGELLLSGSESDRQKARKCFLDAIAQGKKQRAASLTLRAAVSLGRSEAADGMTETTAKVLQTAISGVKEASFSKDYQQANELLNSLVRKPTNAT